MLWSDVLMSQSFTAFGAAQFTRDLRTVCLLLERYLPGGCEALDVLLDGARLLSLPAEADGTGVSLKQASDRVFTDNAEAKKLLEDVEIYTLTPANARRILQRRVENSE
jgi:hypothetical protein